MKRTLLISLIAVAAAILLGTVVLLLVVSRQQPVVDANVNAITNTQIDTTNTITTTTTTSDTTTIDTTTPTTTTDSPTMNDEAALRRVINNFTERFGSYSTDTNYENVALSKSLMTDNMAKAADKIVAKNQQSSGEFYSVESRVMTTTLTDYATGSTGATAEVDVRQTIIAGQANPTYKNITARLTLIKVNDTWKVDSFSWL